MLIEPTPGLLPTTAAGPRGVTRRAALARLRDGAWLAGAGGALALGGCSLAPSHDHDGPDAPRALALTQPVRVAWVLSSGGPRGFVHVGVLRALQMLGLQPDLIVGASVGALVGCLRAAGMDARQIEALALDLSPLSMARLAVGVPERFSGSALADWLRGVLPRPRLDELPLPMACVALHQRSREVVAFTAGDAGVAVQAASAIERQFAPVHIRGEAFVDADLVMPLPVRLARALGAQRVLAVDASAHLENTPPGAERYREGDLRKQAATAADARLADLVLKPDFGYWVSLSREFRERAIAAGQRDTLAQADALRALHRG